jgi:hypothetical protein
MKDNNPNTQLTPDQQAVVASCDDVLKANGLTTYTKLEESLAMALTMCWEAMETGKMLVAKLEKLEKKR